MTPSQEELKQLVHDRIDRLFTYYPPKGDQGERYAKLHEGFRQLALLVADLTPYSHEQSLVLDELWKLRMMANGTIAVNE